ncbi:MAG TPA: hypothetical protein VFU73_01565 [Actinocrinis sp.]|nr:hypothetical protein [Actinocrinis sp.]
MGSADPITAQRAGYVATMLSNSTASGPETESGIMSVIAGYGGGYVTHASLSGAPGPTQKLTLAVVLGGGSIRNSMQGETDMDPAGVACFTFTVGYYDTEGTESQAACPSSLTTADARATATRQIAEQVDAERYDTTIASGEMPATLTAAEQLIGLGGPAGASAAASVTAVDFATGTDGVQHKPDAALALPQSGGGCVYVIYRWVQISRVGGGMASTSDYPLTRAWAAPTDAACTGAAALSAGAFLTSDRYAGG